MAFATVVTVATPPASYPNAASPQVDYSTTDIGFKAETLLVSVSGVAGTDTVAISFDGVKDHMVLGVGTHRVPGSLAQKIWVKKLGGAPTSCSISGSNTT